MTYLLVHRFIIPQLNSADTPHQPEVFCIYPSSAFFKIFKLDPELHMSFFDSSIMSAAHLFVLFPCGPQCAL